MTKYLTTAAWAALVLGGVAVADTPPAESAEVAAEEVATEVESEMTTTYRYGDAEETEVETEVEGTIAAVTIEEADAEDESDAEAIEAEEAEDGEDTVEAE